MELWWDMISTGKMQVVSATNIGKEFLSNLQKLEGWMNQNTKFLLLVHWTFLYVCKLIFLHVHLGSRSYLPELFFCFVFGWRMRYITAYSRSLWLSVSLTVSSILAFLTGHSLKIKTKDHTISLFNSLPRLWLESTFYVCVEVRRK